MFDSYSNDNSFNFKVNAVSGTLRKTMRESKFCIRNTKDTIHLFDQIKPTVSFDLYNQQKEQVVLQVMTIGEDSLLIEYISKEDFDKSFEEEKQDEKEDS